MSQILKVFLYFQHIDIPLTNTSRNMNVTHHKFWKLLFHQLTLAIPVLNKQAKVHTWVCWHAHSQICIWRCGAVGHLDLYSDNTSILWFIIRKKKLKRGLGNLNSSFIERTKGKKEVSFGIREKFPVLFHDLTSKCCRHTPPRNPAVLASNITDLLLILRKWL